MELGRETVEDVDQVQGADGFREAPDVAAGQVERRGF